MRPVTVSGVIRRPVEEVYDFLVDSRNDRLWCPMASGTELVEGEPGLGAVYTFQQALGPGMPPVPVRMETTVADRPTRLEWRTPDGETPYHGTIELTDLGDGTTRMRQTNIVRMPGLQALGWWIGANIALRRQLRNLDRVLGG